MAIEGYLEYQRREYCNDIECPIQLLLNQEDQGSARYEFIRGICKSDCLHTTYEFHHWLMEKGYLLLRPPEIA